MYFLSTRNLDTLWPVYSPFFLVPLFILPLLIPPFIFDDTVSGYCDPRFEPVYQAFRQNFGEGLEREGAAVAIYHKGKRVVNMWGGYADREANRKWRHDTKTVLFSATKAMAALSVAVLVDRGYLSYDDRVVNYWPEYGQHGKENTTIEHILSHMAGIPFLDEHIDLEHLSDFAVLEKNMENSKPLWEPGSASGYHALTFGFLIDALVRRVDEKGRDLQTFFREEIAEPHDIQASIGLPKQEAPFLARITMPTILEFIRDIVKNPKLIPMLILMYVRPDDIVHRIRENPSWLLISFDTMVVNDPEVIQLPIGAVTGVSDADSLARMFSLTMNGQLIGNHTLELLKIPTLNSWHLEKVVLWPVVKGRGFFYERHPVIPGAFLFGHPGYGGQFIAVDPANELVIAYVANGLKTGTGELCGTYMRLFNAMYESLGG